MDDLTKFNEWFDKSMEKVNRVYPKEVDSFFSADDDGNKINGLGELNPSQKRLIDLIKSRYFNLNKDISQLLLNTKNKIEFKEMPFNNIFVDMNFFDGLIEGILISLLINNKDGKIKKDIHVHLRWNPKSIKKDYSHEKLFSSFRMNSIQSGFVEKPFFTGPVDFNKEDKKYLGSLINSGNIEKIALFVCNLLDVLNHPEVEIIEGKEWFNNDKRKERGQPPIPQNFSINLTGKLKKYINKTSQQNEKAWELGHRFWVRGHWMEFKHARYKNKQGQKIWVLPYIKGKGELIKKDYYIGEKEQCWENEKQMIKIIRELYPKHEVKTHDRTTLDGLEIDCYIPELKLGFEYNGKQHYEHVKIFHKTIEDFKKQKERDIEKMKRAKNKGIKIITIRYDEAVIKDVLSKKLNQEDSI